VNQEVSKLKVDDRCNKVEPQPEAYVDFDNAQQESEELEFAVNINDHS